MRKSQLSRRRSPETRWIGCKSRDKNQRKQEINEPKYAETREKEKNRKRKEREQRKASNKLIFWLNLLQLSRMSHYISSMGTDESEISAFFSMDTESRHESRDF